MSPRPISEEAFAEAVAAIREHGSQVAAAKALGIPRTTLQERLYTGQRRCAPHSPTASPEPQPDPIEIRRLRDEIDRLRKTVKSLTRQALDDDAMRGILGSLGSARASPPPWLLRAPARTHGGAGEVPVATWTDWHIGEVVSAAEVNGINEYNLDVAERRIRRLVDNTVHVCTEHGPKGLPGIVVNLGGDFVSGGLHPELAKTDEFELLPSILKARDLLLWGLCRMADAFGRVYVPCVAGNHGRTTQKPEYKRYPFKNADWAIYQLLARDLAGDPRIHIDIRPTNEVDYRIYDLRIKLMHGDMLGVKGGDGIIGAIGPIVRGEIKTRGQATSIGQEYDLLIIGHWHSQLWLPRVMVANTLKGFDEYARLALRAVPSRPSQPLFFVHPRHKVTSRWDIHVEDAKVVAKEWVSWAA